MSASPSLLIIERPGSFRDALVSEIELSGTQPQVRDDAMDALASLQHDVPSLVLVSEDPGPPGAASVCRLVRSKLGNATVFRLGDASSHDPLDGQSPFVPRAIGPTAIARFLIARAENQNQDLEHARAWDAPLGSLELGPLLLALLQRQLTGRLILTSQATERELTFARGYIIGSRSSVFGERLGQVGIKTGQLTAAQVDRALDQSRMYDQRLGEVLLDTAVLDGAKLFSLLCAQLLEQVTAACNTGAGNARFLIDESVIGPSSALRLHPLTAVLLAVRRTPKEDVGRVLDQLADRALSTEHTPELVRTWLEAAGASEPETILHGISSVRALRDRLRERLKSDTNDADSDCVALSLLRAGAMKLPGRASLVPTDLRSGVTTLSPPSVASAVVRCARATFETWPITTVATAGSPLQERLDAYLQGPQEPAAARVAALRGPVGEASEVDPEILALAFRASGTQQRHPGAWVPGVRRVAARDVRLAVHAIGAKLDLHSAESAKPSERLRVAELKWQVDRALASLDSSAVLGDAAARASLAPAVTAKPPPRASATSVTRLSGTGAMQPENAPQSSHAGDPVLLAQVEPLVQQQRWNDLRKLLTSQDGGPANLPPAFALLYAIACKEGEPDGTDAPRQQAEAIGIAAMSEALSIPPHSATALVVAKRALRRRPLDLGSKASGRMSFLFMVLALLCGAAVGVGIVMNPKLMQWVLQALQQVVQLAK